MRRSSVAVIIALALAPLVGDVGFAAAGGSTCAVRNARTGTTDPDLQTAVDAADDGDTLRVRGICVGPTAIRGVTVRLVGVPTASSPTPTLDGAGLSRVLSMRRSSVVLRDLVVTDGEASYGAGVRLEDGSLSLRGSTSITRNAAAHNGGGIWMAYAHLRLWDSSTVHDNTSVTSSGGIDACGRIVLNDASSVTRNSSTTWHGGGVSISGCGVEGTVTLNDTASIRDNAAHTDGGGIYSTGPVVHVNDRATVSGNTAGRRGGGIYANEAAVVLGEEATLEDNVATGRGGGIYARGGPNYPDATILGRGSSSMTGNASGTAGGGIFVTRMRLRLSGSASVVDNLAGIAGGGVRLGPKGRLIVCSDLVAISPNDPDDPPAASCALS